MPVLAVFVIALVAIILEALLLQRLVVQTRQLAEGVRSARLANDRLSDVEDLLVAAEAGQRGYLLIGEDQYLKPYLRAVEQLDGTLADLKKILVADDADRADFNRIDQLLRAKLAELERAIAVYRVSGQRDAINLLGDDPEKGATDEIRQIIKRRRDTIEPVIEKGRAAVYASMDQAKTFTMFAGVISAIVLAMLALTVLRHFARARAKEDILEQTVEARAAQLAELSQHLLSVRETERARIARELHDELGSCLTLLAQDLSQLRRAAAAGDPVSPDVISNMQEVLGQSVQQQRQLVHSLRPPMLDSLGLRAALDALARQFSSNQGMPVEFTADASLDEVDRSAGISLYRIVQESLTNVARHAQATRVAINVTEINDVLVLTVSDDGRGAGHVGAIPGASLGLTGMRERARFLGGTLTVGPGRAGRGTVVEALIPIDRDARAVTAGA
jgi:signal transduction histidine kinase